MTNFYMRKKNPEMSNMLLSGLLFEAYFVQVKPTVSGK